MYFMLFKLASDHRGKKIKDRVISVLEDMGIEYDDLSPKNGSEDDYPDFAEKLARSLGEDFGFLSCGTGIGISIAANRYNNVRAALAMTKEDVLLARKHNDANVLVLPGSVDIKDKELEDLVRLFIETKFEGGRHKRRVDKLS